LDVATTVAVFEPVEENVFVQEDEVPVQTPDHKYVYIPLSPEAEALKVTGLLIFAEPAEQKTESGSGIIVYVPPEAEPKFSVANPSLNKTLGLLAPPS
jgi:hypothetical protein